MSKTANLLVNLPRTKKELERFIAIRDNKEYPENEDEMILKLSYELKGIAAYLEQDAAQRRPSTPVQVQAYLQKEAKKILDYVDEAKRRMRYERVG